MCLFQESAIGYSSLCDSPTSRVFIVEKVLSSEEDDWIRFAWKVAVLGLRPANFFPISVSRSTVSMNITVGRKRMWERIMI